MNEPEKKTRLLQDACANLLLIGGVVALVYGGLSLFNSRLAKLVAPNHLARSASGDYATTDSYLSTLELPNASKQVQFAVSFVPQDAAIIFVAPDSSPETELTYRTIAYLSWPHQVGALHCRANGESPTLLFKPREDKLIRGLMFYRQPVPAGLSAASSPLEFGPHLKLVPIQELKEWTFYCSQ